MLLFIFLRNNKENIKTYKKHTKTYKYIQLQVEVLRSYDHFENGGGSLSATKIAK
jgi:hypothetical protein